MIEINWVPVDIKDAIVEIKGRSCAEVGVGLYQEVIGEGRGYNGGEIISLDVRSAILGRSLRTTTVAKLIGAAVCTCSTHSNVALYLRLYELSAIDFSNTV